MFGLKPSKFTEFCGWYGMLALILAYGLASFNIIIANGVVFQLLNITAALGLMIVAASKSVLQLVVLNAVWVLIGVVVFIRLVL